MSICDLYARSRTDCNEDLPTAIAAMTSGTMLNDVRKVAGEGVEGGGSLRRRVLRKQTGWKLWSWHSSLGQLLWRMFT